MDKAVATEFSVAILASLTVRAGRSGGIERSGFHQLVPVAMDEIKRQAVAAPKLLATLQASNSDPTKIEKDSNTQSRVIQRLLQNLKKTPDIEALQSLSQIILEGGRCEVDKQALADATATAIEEAGGDDARQEWMVQWLPTATVLYIRPYMVVYNWESTEQMFLLDLP